MAAAVAAVLSLASVVPAQATADALDQSQTLTLSFQRGIALMAQTFTAGATGQLDRVSLASDTTTGFANISVSIQSVSSILAPSGTPLGTSAFSGSVTCCRQFHSFAFNPAISITAGTRYAIVVRVLAGSFTWYNSSVVDGYAGGQLYVACSGCAWLTGASWGQDFAFQTWVATSVNQAPTAAADNTAVTIPEGSAPANTGTYSDPDGDTVAITASSGTVTKTGTSTGTWSWTAASSDEASSQAVTITANDGQGHSTATSFTSTVTAVAPSARIVTDPPSIPEGAPETFTGAASSPAEADNAAGFTYAWTVTKNGSAYATGSTASFTFTPDDEGTYVVTFRATDDGSMAGTDSMTIIGTNVAPQAAISGFTRTAPLIAAQESLTFSGSFSDAGALDSHIATWNFGDGSTAMASFGPSRTEKFSASHAYAAAGTYTVTVTVTDDDGGVGKATTTVQVLTTAQALSWIANEVQTHTSLNAGQKNSLTAKLNAASASAARGDTKASNNQLNAFLNELQAYVNTGQVSADEASTLRNAVHAIKGSLGTYNRFLEWWPLGA